VHYLMALNNLNLRKAVNKGFNLPALLKQIDVWVSESGSLQCPLHHHESPGMSAKLFEDNKMWCFTENKMYGAYDILSEIIGIEDSELWKQIKNRPELLDGEDVEVKPLYKDKETVLKLKKQFIKGKLTLDEYLPLLVTEFNSN